ncbi:MAG: TRAP transporter small permease [Betaproteobacteria bacterium]|nr:TRAP transporter small permease [Betaproteobacteria bacterium]
MSTSLIRPGRLGNALRLLSRISALLGGMLLVGIALLTLASVLGRSLFSSPVQGDVEMVQLACAVALSCFLPYTQWQSANIIVDFFTAKASDQTKGRLDALGSLLLGLVAALVCWRAGAGSAMAYENQETSMLIAIPIWIPYLLMLPGFALTAAVSFYIAWEQLTARASYE